MVEVRHPADNVAIKDIRFCIHIGCGRRKCGDGVNQRIASVDEIGIKAGINCFGIVMRSLIAFGNCAKLSGALHGRTTRSAFMAFVCGLHPFVLPR